MKAINFWLPVISVLFLSACQTSPSNDWVEVDFPTQISGTYIGERYCVAIPGADTFDSVLTFTGALGETLWDETTLMNTITNFGGIHWHQGDYVVLIAQDLKNWERPTHPRLADVGFTACQVENSWAEILEVLDDINDTWFSDSDKFSNITWTGLAVITNDILVGLYELNEETIQFFKENVTDSPLVRFEQGGIVTLVD